MKPIVVIPARGGSKGIPGKNIKELGGKPLIQYTIDVAREMFSDEVILVSTDDEKIKAVAENLGLDVPFIRPAELSTDRAGTNEVLLHAVEYVKGAGYRPDTLILLQPTSPFRSADHIQEAIEVFEKGHELVVSVVKAKSNPYALHFQEKEGLLEPVLNSGTYNRRQDLPDVWELNGALYIMKVDALLKKGLSGFKKAKYEMDEISSVDIDSTLDWHFAEFLLEKKLLEKLRGDR